ncbi:hypothetical protein ACJRO7_033655 [Eucalyptus globulus]|uniref:Uncharacterized protein n=1 Tax=Eucalyptus globulus TaxID=34317 RepID=A0ABD3JR21_EUCGL
MVGRRRLELRRGAANAAGERERLESRVLQRRPSKGAWSGVQGAQRPTRAAGVGDGSRGAGRRDNSDCVAAGGRGRAGTEAEQQAGHGISSCWRRALGLSRGGPPAKARAAGGATSQLLG